MFPTKMQVAAITMLLGSYAHAAGEIQGQLNVQLTIGDGCTVTNGSEDGDVNTFGTIDFGSYPSLQSVIDARSFGAASGSSFGLLCSTGTAYSVAIDSGQNADGTQRRMESSGEYVNYNLYQDAARTTPWGDGVNGGTALTDTGDGTNAELIVYGRVPAQPSPAAGNYLDTVQVTITW